ncbi:MAG: MarR family transcriptional regulator [Flavimaricola sp.]|nr:MarR family transcriptional regulator [Flavimaricola sp.]
MTRTASNAATAEPDASSAAASGVEVGDNSLDQLIGYNLKRVYILLQMDFREALAADDLSARVFSALSVTVEHPGISQSDLARQLGIERSGLVAIVDLLEQRHLVQRVAVPGDRRVQALHPTDAGRETYARALATVHRHEEAFFDMVTPQERDQLLAILRKIRRTAE